MEWAAVQRGGSQIWLGALLGLAIPLFAGAQGFSRNEFHYQGGVAALEGLASPPGFQHTLTLQHASAWSRGSNFVFMDVLCCDDPASNTYLEGYSYLSLGALSGREISFGPVRDVSLIGAVNWGAEPRLVKVGPGVQLSLDLPGFAFANLDFVYLVDVSAGPEAGGVPKTDAIVSVDFNWAYPFEIGGSFFSVQGHGEWQSPHGTETGHRRPYSVLLQPQFRYDIGRVLSGAENRVLIGTELQVWINKFAIDGANEILPQFLVVVGF